MPDTTTATGPDALPQATAARTTRARKTPAGTARPKARKPKGPTAPQRAEAEALRQELAAARQELEAVRREAVEAVAECREAGARVAATRADADVVRRAVADIDVSAAAVRGVAEAALAAVERAREQSELAEGRVGRLGERLAASRAEFAALDAEARQALERLKLAAEAARRTEAGEIVVETAAELPEVPALPPEERTADLRERFLTLLGDAGAVEKEQSGLLQTLADESGDAELRALLEDHRAAAQRRLEEVEARLSSLGAKPAAGRGLLGQLANRLWDAFQAPQNRADGAVFAVLKAVSAAEFLAGLYAAANAAAQAAGGSESAKFAAEQFREVRGHADALRAAIAPAVSRAAKA